MTEQLLNREQAAAYLTERLPFTVSSTILANVASRGCGPAYRIWNGRGSGRGGRGRFAVYRPTDLDAWIEKQLYDPKKAVA